jgi:hypothetical protein
MSHADFVTIVSPRRALVLSSMVFVSALVLAACVQDPPATASAASEAPIGAAPPPRLAATAPGSAFPLGPKIPTDIADPSDPQQAATFAWQEFVAVTWPAAAAPSPQTGLSPYLRGQPSPTQVSGQTGAGGVTVFDTYYHRVELYPSYSSGTGNVLPDPNAIPNYNYAGFSGKQPFTPAPGADLTLFNNLDEASEISLAYMYHTPLAAKADALFKAYPNPTPAQQAQIAAANIQAGLVYEAKGNGVIYDYLKTNSFNNRVPRSHALRQSIAQISNMAVTPPVFALPNGALEIKATWRHYDPTVDDLNQFHWTKGIYYTLDSQGNRIANNDTFLLIALHIIQKTPNVPTFTFATFEHVSNEANGFRFTNTNPQTYTPAGFNRALPDPGVIQAIRQFPIPGAGSGFDLVAFNSAVQAQLRTQYGAGNVWANYQLIGIQAVVQDNPGGAVPNQQFFLSNFATETNDSLQFFQGGLTGPNGNVPNPNTGHVFTADMSGKYSGHTAGGCLGCHGSQGQFAGGDFSVIAATGNAFLPEAVTPYPAGSPVVPQNNKGFPLPQTSAGMPQSASIPKKGR